MSARIPLTNVAFARMWTKTFEHICTTETEPHVYHHSSQKYTFFSLPRSESTPPQPYEYVPVAVQASVDQLFLRNITSSYRGDNCASPLHVSSSYFLLFFFLNHFLQMGLSRVLNSFGVGTREACKFEVVPTPHLSSL